MKKFLFFALSIFISTLICNGKVAHKQILAEQFSLGQISLQSHRQIAKIKADKLQEQKAEEAKAQAEAQAKAEADAQAAADAAAKAQAEAAAAPLNVTAPVAPAISYAAGGGCEQWRGLLSQYSWNISVAIAVCNAESGGNPNNINAGDIHPTCMGSYGLFQIGCDSTGGNPISALYDPATNIAQAWALYSSRGWQPWGATTCAYKVACY